MSRRLNRCSAFLRATPGASRPLGDEARMVGRPRTAMSQMDHLTDHRSTFMLEKVGAIVAAYVSRNAIEVTALPALIDQVHAAIAVLRRAPSDFPSGKAGDVLVVEFTLCGAPFIALNGGPQYRFTEAVSFQIPCADQAEVDRLWTALSDGGSEGRCGWLKDRWGVSWQVVPVRLQQLLADPDMQVEVPGLGDRGPRMLSRQALAGVIEPRIEEIFSLVQQVVRDSGFEEVLSSGIVLTGGSAIMPGMVELGEDIFLKPVRRGLPHYSGALSDMVSQPRAATVMGLLEEARLGRMRGFKVAQKNGSVKTAMGRVKDWFVGNF